MENYIKILSRSQLFNGIKNEEIEEMLFYLKPTVRTYKKGSVIISSGGPVTDLCIVLEGCVQITKEDIHGNKSIIDELYEGGMFAEALACAKVKHSPVTVISITQAKILFIDFEKLFTIKPSVSVSAGQIIKNLTFLISRKNVFLNNKLEHVSKRTIREKLLSYFNELVIKNGKAEIKLPFSKTALADYLFIDRSAMSRELANMKAQKIIDYEGSNFKILEAKKYK